MTFLLFHWQTRSIQKNFFIIPPPPLNLQASVQANSDFPVMLDGLSMVGQTLHNDSVLLKDFVSSIVPSLPDINSPLFEDRSNLCKLELEREEEKMEQRQYLKRY